ncbi:MAG: hypothetical protein ACON4U_16585 [Myxococcota bacterium]
MSLSRRTMLTGLTAAGALGGTAFAQPSIGGFLPAAPKRFINGVLLRTDGTTQSNMGIEIGIEGNVSVVEGLSNGIDLNGQWICPSFVDAGSQIGLYEVELESRTHDQREEQPVDPSLNDPIDGYNALSTAIPTIRANGISHALIHPSQSGLVAGQISSVRLAGMLSAEAAVERGIALGVCLGNAGKGGDGPSSRMGIVQHLRDKLDGFDRSPEPKKRLFKPDLTEISHDAPEMQIWQDIRDGTKPIVFQANRVDDIDLAVRLITEYNLHGVIQGAAEAWMVADSIAEAKIGLLLGPLDVQPNNFEHLRARYDNAALLHRAGVQFAFRSGANHDARMLPTKAAIAVAHGLPFGEAIKALTVNVSEILRIEPLVGDIGDHTSFFICDGDPLQAKHHIHRMWIEGQEVTLRTRQIELAERFRVLD